MNVAGAKRWLRSILLASSPAVPPAPLERCALPRPGFLADVLRSAPEKLTGLFGSATARTLVLALRMLADAERQARAGEERLPEHLARRAGILRATHRRAALDLLHGAQALERRVRACAWALDGPARVPVRAIDADALDPVPSGLVWWLGESPAPERLFAAARAGACRLLVDEPATSHVRGCAGALVGIGHARVEPGGAERPAVALPIAAAVVQAVRSGMAGAAWNAVRPPRGFVGLDRDHRMTEVLDLLRHGRIAALRASASAPAIVLPRVRFPKTMPGERLHPWTESIGALAGKENRAMGQRLKSEIQLPQEISDAEPASVGSITFVAPWTVRADGARSKDELRRQLREVRINSVEDLCRAYPVQVRGTYRDVEGNQQDVAIPVVDEETFTIDGMTRSDPKLLAMYVRARTYEECTRFLEDSQRGLLTDRELAHLEAAARCLEEALKENGDE